MSVRTAGLSLETRLRHSPVERALGMRPVPAESGRFAVRAPLDDAVRDAHGRVATLLVALLADAGIGFLVFASAGLRAGAPTVDLRLDHLGPAAPAATAVTAELHLLHLDDEIGVGRAELCDDTGRPVAHAVATMAVTAAPDRPGGLAGAGGVGPAGAGGGTAGGDDDFRAGVPPFDPARLAPDRLETDGGDVVFTPGPTVTNLNGTAHGAVLAALARAAQDREYADAVRPLSDTVEYLRPVPLDGRLRVRTAAIRSGRRFRTLRTELLLPDDRVAVRVVTTGARPTGQGPVTGQPSPTG